MILKNTLGKWNMIASLYILDIARKTTQYRWEEIAERCGQYEAAGGES